MFQVNIDVEASMNRTVVALTLLRESEPDDANLLFAYKSAMEMQMWFDKYGVSKLPGIEEFEDYEKEIPERLLPTKGRETQRIVDEIKRHSLPNDEPKEYIPDSMNTFEEIVGKPKPVMLGDN